VPDERQGGSLDGEVKTGDLYQQVRTGTLLLVTAVTAGTVRVRLTDPPYTEFELARKQFLDRYAVADSA